MNFFDTNILVYAVDESSPLKRRQAMKIIDECQADQSFVISTQVLHELYNALTRRFTPAYPHERAASVLTFFAQSRVIPQSVENTLAALELKTSLKLSWWDALIVEAAQRANANVLYSEDMQHGQRIGDRMKIINPFS